LEGGSWKSGDPVFAFGRQAKHDDGSPLADRGCFAQCQEVIPKQVL